MVANGMEFEVWIECGFLCGIGGGFQGCNSMLERVEILNCLFSNRHRRQIIAPTGATHERKSKNRSHRSRQRRRIMRFRNG